MRKAGRVAFVVMLVFLLQSTTLTYFKLNGVMIDLLSIALCAIGYACGMYTGVTAGLLAALIMEVMAGDLNGLMAVACVGAGAYGAWVARKLSQFTRVGNRRQERMVKRFAPMLAIGLFSILKESVYVIYFYLMGVEIAFVHVFRVVFSGVVVTLLSLLLLPLTYWFVLLGPENTAVARWLARRKKKGRAKPVLPQAPQPVTVAVPAPAVSGKAVLPEEDEQADLPEQGGIDE